MCSMLPKTLSCTCICTNHVLITECVIRCDCAETGNSVFLPLALDGWGSWGDAGLLGVCVSAGVTGTGEGGWAGGGDTWGDGGRPAGGVGCTGSAGGLGSGSKNEDDTWETPVSSSWFHNKLICPWCHGITSSRSPSHTKFMLSRTYNGVKADKKI